MKRIAMLALLACAALRAVGAQQEQAIDLKIAAGQVAEVCMPLAARDTLAWHFRASAAVDFNLHDHVGQQVDMPVQRRAVKQHRARHTVPRANDWCLMWTAPAASAVTVRGAWHAKPAAAR